ncbi:CGNR zinc finger domain-containing protein [Microbacterium xanthum]|uniref:CGNR zinc finger domain-containing protein n=1 Tax=Microbacterium xanthum TaxID=3079794 RepID=UPI002AD3F8DA|nr:MULTISPECIES: CGNR zinc finger domain-containing protein [unclassified Microbacterium]MDZ8171658.1 CGNR zinc finger domain-containing protein [Microbacterium sp. KSW-48]MDZ8200249.1 CGNR zinc finger domain-containing protein [Microbacterium sp. SSW1-59]
MAFAPDTVEALESSVFLANTALEPDTLIAPSDLEEFYVRFSYTGAAPTGRELEPVRDIRSRLRQLFTADRDDAVPLVNAILVEQRAIPQLTRHGETDWHIHATTEDRPFHERILVETAMAMIDVIRADEMGRFGRCGAADCEGVVIDLSRNRSRKYCSTTCTNREAVAAYRSRQRS